MGSGDVVEWSMVKEQKDFSGHKKAISEVSIRKDCEICIARGRSEYESKS